MYAARGGVCKQLMVTDGGAVKWEGYMQTAVGGGGGGVCRRLRWSDECEDNRGFGRRVEVRWEIQYMLISYTVYMYMLSANKSVSKHLTLILTSETICIWVTHLQSLMVE
jgi:hypothetical protein